MPFVLKKNVDAVTTFFIFMFDVPVICKEFQMRLAFLSSFLEYKWQPAKDLAEKTFVKVNLYAL